MWHEGYTNNKSATQVKNFDFDNETSKSIFSQRLFTIWQVRMYACISLFRVDQINSTKINNKNWLFSLKIGREAEFLISSATFFQSLLALFAMLSKPNFFFWDSKIQIHELFSDCKCFLWDLGRHSYYQEKGYSGIYKPQL